MREVTPSLTLAAEEVVEKEEEATDSREPARRIGVARPLAVPEEGGL